MSLKLKALCLGVIAATTLSATVAVNASATAGGHLVSELTHTAIEGFEFANHQTHFAVHGLNGSIGCRQDIYSSTSATKTITAVTIKPEYSECFTTADEEQKVTIDESGCTYEFTVALNTTANTEQTMHLLCPTGKKIEITHSNCTIAIHPQTVNTGFTYTPNTNPESGKHQITLDVKVQLNHTLHGLCQFVAPTNGTGTVTGSVTVSGWQPEGVIKQVNITVT